MGTGEEKKKVFQLSIDYAVEAHEELESLASENRPTGTLVEAVQALALFVPFAQSQALAISVSVKARVVKMAALYDFALTMKVVEEHIFRPLRATLPDGDDDGRHRLEAVRKRIREELQANVAES